MNSKKGFMLSLFVMKFINVAFAKPNTVEFLNEAAESSLEVIVATLAVVAAYFAFKVKNDVKGGQLEEAFNYFAFASLTFAVLEIYNLVAELWVEVTGLGDLIELTFVVLLIVGFTRAQKALK